MPVAVVYFRRKERRLLQVALGWKGERAVGDTLKELERRGYHVFHDLVFDKFNIDHVVVGPGGVFTVETKTRSKRVKNPSTAHVTWDGQELRIDKALATEHIGQAKGEAAELGNLLRDAGVNIWVRAVLLFPGWYVDAIKSRDDKDVFVCNDTYFVRSFDYAEPTLSAEQVQRVVSILDAQARS